MRLTAEAAVEALRAAGEPTRLRILALLHREELAVMELGQILDQSQPRVSRHLKLLTEAGLVERFPDGAWMFYRLAAHGPRRVLIDRALAMIDPEDAELSRDQARLNQVHAGRMDAAADYFARNAVQWDHLRALYVAEAEVEAAVLAAAGPGPFERLVDLGSGTGRMLTLFGQRARQAVGLDLSQQMLNVARRRTGEAGLSHCELRHGDIFNTRLPDGFADLVVVHQVLHYLSDPGAALAEAARLVEPQGRLLVVDFAPHRLEYLREAHQHRRLGFSDTEMQRWFEAAGLEALAPVTLPATRAEGLTVKIWTAARAAADARNVA